MLVPIAFDVTRTSTPGICAHSVTSLGTTGMLSGLAENSMSALSPSADTFLPPTALKLMRHAAVPAGVDVRSIGSGGESLGADLHAWGHEVLGAPINEIYGQTECNLVISTCHGAMELKPGSMGKAVPGHDVAIIGADGAGKIVHRDRKSGVRQEIGRAVPRAAGFDHRHALAEFGRGGLS